jgi:hypothetical protein
MDQRTDDFVARVQRALDAPCGCSPEYSWDGIWDKKLGREVRPLRHCPDCLAQRIAAALAKMRDVMTNETGLSAGQAKVQQRAAEDAALRALGGTDD